jgi:hypothetical protein
MIVLMRTLCVRRLTHASGRNDNKPQSCATFAAQSGSRQKQRHVPAFFAAAQCFDFVGALAPVLLWMRINDGAAGHGVHGGIRAHDEAVANGGNDWRLQTNLCEGTLARLDLLAFKKSNAA